MNRVLIAVLLTATGCKNWGVDGGRYIPVIGDQKPGDADAAEIIDIDRDRTDNRDPDSADAPATFEPVGTWAVEEQYTADADIAGTTGKLIHRGMARWDIRGTPETGYKAEIQYCWYDLNSLIGLEPKLPPALVERFISRDVPVVVSGDELRVTDWVYRQALSDEVGADDPLPAVGDPKLLDGDEDGNPGNTIGVFNRLGEVGKRYMARRVVYSFDVRATDGDHLDGMVTTRTSEKVYGATSSILTASAIVTDRNVPGENYAKFTRVTDGADCAAIRAAFPPAEAPQKL